MNTAARILCKIPKFDNITKTLLDLHWLPIQQRIRFKIRILTYQTYHRSAPQYLCDFIIPYSNVRDLRSDIMLLIAPCHPRAKFKSYRDKSFQYAAPTEWNKLPLLIRKSPSMNIFKTQLKKVFIYIHIRILDIIVTVVLSLFLIVHINLLITISIYYIELNSHVFSYHLAAMPNVSICNITL